jgi:Protein kinase domain
MDEGDRWAGLEPGSEFAGYRIERRLGRGGMGIVYEATEPGLERRVALKLIAPEAAAEPIFLKRFEHESRIAARVEHPNVVPIYAAGAVDGVPFIAMRFVSGSDLGKRIREAGTFDPARAVSIVAQTAGGLDALHAAGLIHRDVKPANVLLSGAAGAEHAYLTDFGVARNVSSTSGLTRTGRFVGTLDYVAPEQIRGGKIDARVDVYALGGMLYKTLTGEVPFPREGEAAKLYAHLNDDPPAPSLFTPLVPASLDRVIARAMAKDPAERYPSAGDLGRAATAAITGGEVAEPERTVATGAAAGARTAELGPEPTRTATAPAAAGVGGGGGDETAATTRPVPPEDRPDRTQKRRRTGALALAAGAAALVAIVVVALLGGADDGSETADTAGSESPASPPAERTEEGTPDERQPAPLTRSELIAKADDICVDSQNQFVNVSNQFPDGEESHSPAFARRLVQISGLQVSRLEELAPPKEVAKPFADYVELRRKVHEYDKNVHAAALAGDGEEFERWRQANFDEGPERFDLAQQIGFKICSANPAPEG